MLDPVRSRVRSSRSGVPLISVVEIAAGHPRAFIRTSCKAGVPRRWDWCFLGLLRISILGPSKLFKGVFRFESS
jgi:hypothetical protein